MGNEIKCPKCGEVFKLEDSGYAAIVKQVRDKEFSKEIETRKQQFETDKENALTLAKLELEKDYDKKLNDKENEISKLKSEISANKIEKDAAISETEAKKNQEIADLKNKLSSFDKDKELEIAKLKSEMNEKLSQKENDINNLKNEQALSEKEYLLKEQSVKDRYETELRFKDEEIERYKDFKTRLSTKMLGESLEQHCEISFNQLRATGFQNAYFEKDNDARTGKEG